MVQQIPKKVKRAVSGLLSASMVLSLFTGFTGASAAEAAQTLAVNQSRIAARQNNVSTAASKDYREGAEIAMPLVLDQSGFGSPRMPWSGRLQPI